MMAKYFGTNGIRGTMETVGTELALQAAQAIGSYFKCGKILVARDHRLTGEALRNAVVAGLQSVGCDVIDIGIATSPTAEFMLKKLGGDGLIIITASHNPPEYNGLKVIDGKGVSISKERGGEIEKLFGKAKPAAHGAIKPAKEYRGSAREHMDAMMALLHPEKFAKRKPFIILDIGNGTAATIAPQLFKELGCKILSINSHMDGHFPGRPSEPREENIQDLIRMVKETKADAGIAWDGDGDRVVFVDEKGNFVVGDKVYALSVLLKLKEGKGDVLTTVATSKAVEDVASKFGCKTIYTKVGAPYMSEEMAKGKAAIAGEEVGGVIYPELSLAKDGIFTAAKIVEAICGKPLSKWMEEIPAYYNVKARVECGEKGKKSILDGINRHAKQKGYKIMDIDGIRLTFDDSWVIVRASGTEPYVRIFGEAKSKGKAEALVKEYEKLAKGFL
jgi:phosphomannomutase/phosphoglucomutase